MDSIPLGKRNTIIELTVVSGEATGVLIKIGGLIAWKGSIMVRYKGRLSIMFKGRQQKKLKMSMTHGLSNSSRNNYDDRS
jgi:hypothetical protein